MQLCDKITDITRPLSYGTKFAAVLVAKSGKLLPELRLDGKTIFHYVGDKLHVRKYDAATHTPFDEPVAESELSQKVKEALEGVKDAGDVAGTAKAGIRESGLDSGVNSNYTTPVGGGGVSNQVTINGQIYTFGHGGRREIKFGFDSQKVENAIANRLSQTKNIVWDNKSPYKDNVIVDGKTYEFRAFKVGDKINIGTYIPKD